MEILKKPLSILLSLVMILSVFTIIPMSASAEGAPYVTLSKWVEATQVDQDLFSFEGLYGSFIICRVNPDKNPKTEANPWAQNVVYDKTNDLSMTGDDTNFAKNDNNYYQLEHYYGDNSHKMWGTWKYSQYYENSDLVYLRDNDVHFSDGCKFWAYTWVNVPLSEHAPTSPSYADGVYKNGTTRTYYTCEEDGVYFVSDGNDVYSQISEEELFTVPYFEYEYVDSINTVRLKKCNSDDADVTVPDVIPQQYYPEDAPAGKACTIIKEEAFKDRTSLVNVTIGNNVNHIAGKKDGMKGAFCGCTALKTVTVGSNCDYVGELCFENCPSMTDFTTTSTKESDFFLGVKNIANDNGALTVHCYHNSGIIRKLYSYRDKITFEYLDAEPVVHSPRVLYEVGWDWSGFNIDDPYNSKVYVTLDCEVCWEDLGKLEAEVVLVVDTPPTCTENGSGHYKAVVTYEGQTFEDDPETYFGYPKYFCTIPACHVWDTADSAVDWTWTPADGEDPGAGNITATATVHCKNCDATDTLNATVEYSGTDLPDCTAVGYVHYTASAECGDVTLHDTKAYTVPALGHRMDHHDAVAATCTDDGIKEYWVCSVCGKYYADEQGNTELSYPDEVIIPKAHTLVHHSYKEPEAFKDGNIEYWQCSVCGKYFSDANGEQEITKAQTVILGKSYVVKDRAYTIDKTYATVRVTDGNPNPQKNILYYTGDTPVPHVTSYGNPLMVFHYGNGKLTVERLDGGGYLAVVRKDDDYAFTGLFYVTEESVLADGATEPVKALVFHPLYVKVSEVTDGNWSWDVENTPNSASVNFLDYYYYTDGGYQHTPSGVVYTFNGLIALRQNVVASVTYEDTTPATCTESGVRSYTATATKVNATFTKTAEVALSPNGHSVEHHPAAPPTTTANGNTEYWECTACGKFFSDENAEHEIEEGSWVIPMLSHFPKHSLTLNGDIGVNFYLDLSAEELAQGVRVDFAWNGKSDSASFNSESTAETREGAEGLYKATCYVCAAEMNDEITVSITVGDSTEPIATETYKVRDYADVIIENKDGKFSDALIALVKTMLNYGAAAQNQFSHNTDALANAEIGYELVGLDENEINGITGDVPDKTAINSLLTNSGIEYYGYSLILKTKTTLRFYFKKNGADTSQLALVNCDNVNIGTVKDYNDAYCFIEIEGIPAYELSDCYTLKYGDISLGSFSALSYVKDVLLNDNGAQPITDTVTALYRYHEAAKSFFDHPTPGQEETDIRPGN